MGEDRAEEFGFGALGGGQVVPVVADEDPVGGRLDPDTDPADIGGVFADRGDGVAWPEQHALGRVRRFPVRIDTRRSAADHADAHQHAR